MSASRDDFGIAIRSALLQRGAATKFSLISLIILAIIINIVFVYIILKSSKHIGNWLGKSGINIIRKVFGIVLLAIAVKLFTSNIGKLL